MPVLNRVEGVYRGSALVAFVRVAGRVIWQAKKIVGWNKIAGPYEVIGVNSAAGTIDFDKDHVRTLKKLSNSYELHLRGDDGRYYKINRINSFFGSVAIEKSMISGIVGQGSMVSFYQPVWG